MMSFLYSCFEAKKWSLLVSDINLEKEKKKASNDFLDLKSNFNINRRSIIAWTTILSRIISMFLSSTTLIWGSHSFLIWVLLFLKTPKLRDVEILVFLSNYKVREPGDVGKWVSMLVQSEPKEGLYELWSLMAHIA